MGFAAGNGIPVASWLSSVDRRSTLTGWSRSDSAIRSCFPIGRTRQTSPPRSPLEITPCLGQGTSPRLGRRCTAAAQTALIAKNYEGLARAALGLGGLWVHEHRTAVAAARVAAWQRLALEQLSPASPLAFRLANRLAAEADYAAGTSGRILAAVETARSAPDPIALAEALSLAHHCLLSPDQASARLELAEELLGVAAITGRPVDAMLGLLWRTVDLFLIGDPHAERSSASSSMRTIATA